MSITDEAVKNPGESAPEEGARTRIKSTIAVMSGKGGVGRPVPGHKPERHQGRVHEPYPAERE
jgi:hypothetical protein